MMSKALRASVLVLLLVCPARAGWMPNGSPEPPPAAPSTLQQETAGNANDAQGGSANSLTDIVLGLLSSVGSLF